MQIRTKLVDHDEPHLEVTRYDTYSVEFVVSGSPYTFVVNRWEAREASEFLAGIADYLEGIR